MMREPIGTILSSSCVLAVVVALSTEAHAKAQIVTFDVPGATSTEAVSINAGGAITGIWGDAAGAHGFLRQRDGTITTFDVPGADPAFGTRPSSINKKDYITGNYATLNDRGKDVPHVFIRSPDGTINTFGVPNNGRYDYPVKITTDRAVIGSYLKGRVSYGFIKPHHGKTTIFQDQQNDTVVTAANNLNAATGWIIRTASAFVRNPDGTFTYFAIGALGTEPRDINDEATVVGSAGADGFVRTSDGEDTEFDAGGTQTFPYAVNNHGAITGSFNGDPGSHGFVRDPSGSITIFDPEGALFTQARSINGRGIIAGSYSDQQGLGHGFIRYP